MVMSYYDVERIKNGEKKAMKRRKNKKKLQMALLSVTVLAVIVVGIVGLRSLLEKKGYIGKEDDTVEANADPTEQGNGGQQEQQEQEQTEQQAQRQELMKQADRLAASYDYDGAISLLQTIEDYDTDTELQGKISEYEATKASCVSVNIDEVTHIFYHTLVVDPERAFANQETNPQAVGNNQWMTTVSEFEKITQEMYDRGFVMVSIHDLIEVTTDESGATVFKPATIMLPPGKKAFVMSLDDLSYYHSYDGYGYASKLVLDENGKVTCEYIQADGTTVLGAYDAVPLMDRFIEEHPDASYKGAKGIIALTGYNGILGYRTDISYSDINGDLKADKRKWLEDNPDFDLEQQRAEAKKIADAMKESGWEFASHTWGHLRVGDISLDRLQADTQKWRENVEPLVGATDTIIFAHGQDLGLWGNYDESNEKYQYLREQGYSIFCNVDSKQYNTWFGTDYMRQGRRNLDGFRIYFNSIGEQDNLSDLFDSTEIIDPLRPPVPPLG